MQGCSRHITNKTLLSVITRHRSSSTLNCVSNQSVKNTNEEKRQDASNKGDIHAELGKIVAKYLQANNASISRKPKQAQTPTSSTSTSTPDQVDASKRSKDKVTKRRSHKDQEKAARKRRLVLRSIPANVSRKVRRRIPPTAAPTTTPVPFRPALPAHLQAILDSSDDPSTTIQLGVQGSASHIQFVRERVKIPNPDGTGDIETVIEPPPLYGNLVNVLGSPCSIFRQADPRTGRQNFHQHFATLPPPAEMRMNVLSKFVKPSEHSGLSDLAREHGCTLAGSTSSLTSVLIHIWRILHPHAKLDRFRLTGAFDALPRDLAFSSVIPAKIQLANKQGVWTVNADKREDDDTDVFSQDAQDLLSNLGHVGEKLLTASAEEFAKYRLDYKHSDPDWEAKEMAKPQAYSYAKCGALLMRSQLDARDERLPRKTFDVKTRATISIRKDRLNVEAGSLYKLENLTGDLGSYEREMYDLYRSAFLKYSFQARIGNMDGIFIAFHNTRQVMGYTYWPLEDMDLIWHASHAQANRTFSLACSILETILTRITRGVDPTSELSIAVDAIPAHRILSIFVRPGRNGPVERHIFQLSKDVQQGDSWNVTLKHGVAANTPQVEDDERAVLAKATSFSSEVIPEGLSAEALAAIEAHNNKLLRKTSQKASSSASAASTPAADQPSVATDAAPTDTPDTPDTPDTSEPVDVKLGFRLRRGIKYVPASRHTQHLRAFTQQQNEAHR